MSSTQLHLGDCLDVLRSMDSACVDAIVTDPPYGLSFMGKGWDYQVPSVEIWEECLRVLKPGGHLLAFAGTRTQHRMCVNIEDAGFEIRDMIAWLYGSGFPKSQNVGKAIDKAAGAEHEKGNAFNVVGGTNASNGGSKFRSDHPDYVRPQMITPEAQQWDGWGTALKPALEPITVARKPFKGTVANNVLEHGTGAINIDGCRVATDENPSAARRKSAPPIREAGSWANDRRSAETFCAERPGEALGRWPANLIHDGSEEVTELTGDAARFFYCPKANKKDREDGNTHPTVKPTDLMAYLCRLVTPPSGIILDPFMGSGSTGKAAMREGFGFIGIERDEEYFEIASSRIAIPAQPQLSLIV